MDMMYGSIPGGSSGGSLAAPHRACVGGDACAYAFYFKIAFEGSSPEDAQNVTSRLTELVIEEDSRLRKTQARVTQEFFMAEKTRTETQLNDAEHELASFMAQHPRFALDATPLTNGAAIRASLGGAGTSGQDPGWPPPGAR